MHWRWRNLHELTLPGTYLSLSLGKFTKLIKTGNVIESGTLNDPWKSICTDRFRPDRDPYSYCRAAPGFAPHANIHPRESFCHRKSINKQRRAAYLTHINTRVVLSPRNTFIFLEFLWDKNGDVPFLSASFNFYKLVFVCRSSSRVAKTSPHGLGFFSMVGEEAEKHTGKNVLIGTKKIQKKISLHVWTSRT